jgi:hypothetical protein
VSPIYAITVHANQVIRNANNQLLLFEKYKKYFLRRDRKKTKPMNNKLKNGEKICSETERSESARINPE